MCSEKGQIGQEVHAEHLFPLQVDVQKIPTAHLPAKPKLRGVLAETAGGTAQIQR